LCGVRFCLVSGLCAVVFILGVAASDRVEKLFGRSDPSEVTVDEFVGMLIAYLGHSMTWSSVTIIFIIYRLFDIFKPFPARQCERLPGGLGIMTDDLVAGIYANLAFWLIVLIF
jgi:phosphatidylglycerophosphatase A